jgi:hypothetical protein
MAWTGTRGWKGCAMCKYYKDRAYGDPVRIPALTLRRMDGRDKARQQEQHQPGRAGGLAGRARNRLGSQGGIEPPIRFMGSKSARPSRHNAAQRRDPGRYRASPSPKAGPTVSLTVLQHAFQVCVAGSVIGHDGLRPPLPSSVVRAERFRT